MSISTRQHCLAIVSRPKYYASSKRPGLTYGTETIELVLCGPFKSQLTHGAFRLSIKHCTNCAAKALNQLSIVDALTLRVPSD